MVVKKTRSPKIAATPIKGTIVIYVPIGNLIKEKVEECLEKTKKNLADWVESCERAGYKVIFIPSRNRQDMQIEQLIF